MEYGIINLLGPLNSGTNLVNNLCSLSGFLTKSSGSTVCAKDTIDFDKVEKKISNNKDILFVVVFRPLYSWIKSCQNVDSSNLIWDKNIESALNLEGQTFTSIVELYNNYYTNYIKLIRKYENVMYLDYFKICNVNTSYDYFIDKMATFNNKLVNKNSIDKDSFINVLNKKATENSSVNNSIEALYKYEQLLQETPPDNSKLDIEVKYFFEPDNLSDNIFISIASYRDPELIRTITELFKKATEPNKITVGVCIQDSLEYYENFPFKNHPQVRILFMEHQNARGVCFARSKIQLELLKNEKYYLQIDSHTRFLQGWDTQLLEQLEKCNDGKAILSCYPNPYFLDDDKEEYLKNKYLSPHKYLHFASGCIRTNTSGVPGTEILPSNWIAAGFIFTYSYWCREVAYPSNIFFNGEEDYLLIKSYLTGYHIFCPPVSSVWHCYTPAKKYSRNLLHEDIDIGKINVSNKELVDLIATITDEQNEEFKKLFGACYKTQTLMAQFDVQKDKIIPYENFRIHNNKLNIFLWAITDPTATNADAADIEVDTRKKLSKCLNTADKYKLNTQLLGIKYDINFLVGLNWYNSLAKFYLLKDITEHDDNNNVIMILEGESILFNGSEKQIMDKFKKIGAKILFGADKEFTYQWGEYRDNFDKEQSAYRYVCSNNIIGYSKDINKMAKECIKFLENAPGNDRGNDCGIIGRFVHENIEKDLGLKIDTKCEIFWMTTRDKTIFENNYDFNIVTKTNPLILNVFGGPAELYQNTYDKIMSKKTK